MIGEFGNISIIMTFLSLFILWGVTYKKDLSNNVVKTMSVVHLLLVVISIICLYIIIFNDRFEYSYVWKHSAIDQEFAFKLSCLWEGQEGSFLLWIFWNSLLILFIAFNERLRKSLLFLVPIQAYLVSLILGIEFLGVEIGMSPFSLLKDTIQSEVYAIDPNFIPTDGKGMNALLQNYWMVIHPPVIFMGFAISAMPFCLCMAGVAFDTDKGAWVKEAYPWAIISVISLGIGMLMGAYWAYETLNFGGFWNWDPVENAIYIPWLILIGVMHLMLIYKKKRKALNQLVILTLLSYLLVIYSTFLTRSGVLGESSVHSFTDLGLSGQLLIFLLLLIAFVVFFYVRVYKFLVNKDLEDSTYSNYEFWMFLGVLLLCISGFQIFLPTSFPVFNKLAGLVDYPLALAAPSDQASFYSDFQIWFGLSFMVLIVIGQFVFRKNELKTSLTNLLFVPAILTAVCSLGLYFLIGVQDSSQLIIFGVLIMSIFLLLVSFMLFSKSSIDIKNVSSSLSHLGLMVLFIGAIVSQGYKKILTTNTQFSDKLNRLGNTLLVRSKPMNLGEFTVTYNNSFFRSKNGERIDKTWLKPTFKKGTLIATKEFKLNDHWVERGEEIELDSKNSFYNISIQTEQHNYNIEPRVQMNSQMGVIASPDIHKKWHGDIYTHVSNFPDPNEKTDWSKAKPLDLSVDNSIMLGSKVLRFDSVNYYNSSIDSSVVAHLSMVTPDSTYSVSPVISYDASGANVVAAEIPDKGIKLVIYKSDLSTSSLGFYYLSTPKDWITIKSIYFPMINLFWLGGLMMLLGMFMTLYSYVNLPVNVTKLKSVSTSKKRGKSLVYNLSKS